MLLYTGETGPVGFQLGICLYSGDLFEDSQTTPGIESLFPSFGNVFTFYPYSLTSELGPPLNRHIIFSIGPTGGLSCDVQLY